ncbi:MAG: hypothetical protein Q9211_003723 [Gyalolechia sp. 1 TL-2023]
MLNVASNASQGIVTRCRELGRLGVTVQLADLASRSNKIAENLCSSNRTFVFLPTIASDSPKVSAVRTSGYVEAETLASNLRHALLCRADDLLEKIEGDSDGLRRRLLSVMHRVDLVEKMARLKGQKQKLSDVRMAISFTVGFWVLRKGEGRKGEGRKGAGSAN